MTYLKDQPGDAKIIIAKKKLESTPKDVQGMLDGDRIYDLATNRELLLGKDDTDTTRTLAKILTFLTERELVANAVKPASLIDTTFVPGSEAP